MPSPFPGMDPYLEGYLWPDVHSALAGQIRRQLEPLLRPRYVARLNIYMVGDRVPAHEIGVVFPDVEIIRPARPPSPPETQSHPSPRTAITPAPASVPVTLPLQVRLTSIHIRDTAKNELVTAIEILSPVNKREPGLTAYRQKRDELMMAGVHLLEIDLLRRGTRPWDDPRWPRADYVMSLVRRHNVQAEVWPVNLQEPLPVLPVPLREPDPDVPLDLPTALATIYDEAYYAATLDYNAPPPEPPLSEDDARWVDEVLRQSGWRK